MMMPTTTSRVRNSCRPYPFPETSAGLNSMQCLTRIRRRKKCTSGVVPRKPFVKASLAVSIVLFWLTDKPELEKRTAWDLQHPPDVLMVMFSKQTTIDENAGMIPRAVQDLFQQIEEKCDGNAVVELSYLEIYNEALHDLLAHKNKKILRIHEHMNGEVYVSGLTARTVTSPQEVGALMEEAASRRIVASNAMNAASSRSHAICVLRVKGLIQNSNTTGSGTDKFTSKLTLVDLAGSERLKKTGSQGCRRKEGININKSLLVLGQVVSALADRNKKHAWRPPYRDSKLTRLLQDSLGGNCRTIMLACVSPADCQMEESLNTLRYATSARNIKNTATRNILKNISPEEAASLLRENQLLKKQVEDLQHALQLLQQGTQHPALKDGMVSEDEQQQQQQRRLFAKMTSEDVPDNFTRDVDDSLQSSHGRPQISTHCQDQRVDRQYQL